jgi:hypothetical protein
LGILSNGKPNAESLLGKIGDLLVSAHKMSRSVTLSLTEKAEGPGFPAPDWIIETLVFGSRLALVGVGD